MKKILFVHPYLATFVKIDLDILQSEHDVRPLYVRHHNLLHLLLDTIDVIRGVLWADIVFAWFGGYHALLPFALGRLLGRKCVVVASGYDVANMPEIDYGNMRPGIKRYIGLAVFHLAHKILAVSQFTYQEVVRNVRILPTKLQVIYHGLEVPLVNEEQVSLTKRWGVLTVGTVKQTNLYVKGLNSFVEMASYLPNIPFLQVGAWLDDSIDYLSKKASSNVKFAGYLYGNELFERMLTAKVYVQASASESFGMSVAEAMLCGCIPVVSDRGALPEVVGGTGFIVPYGDEQATVEAIRYALAAKPEDRERCRQYIIDNFPLNKRKEKLLQAIREIFE